MNPVHSYELLTRWEKKKALKAFTVLLQIHCINVYSNDLRRAFREILNEAIQFYNDVQDESDRLHTVEKRAGR